MANKNSFKILQEDEAQEAEGVEDLVQGETLPGPSDPLEIVTDSAKAASPKLAPSGSKKETRNLDLETSSLARLAALVPTCGSKGNSDPEDFSAPYPPLIRGQKSKKEWREKEAASNIFWGCQSQLDPFIKGHFTSHSN